MKFTKVFRGVPDGGIYPVEYQPGDACPPELAHAAVEAEAVEVIPTAGATISPSKAAKPKT